MNAPGREQHQRRRIDDGSAAGTCPKNSRGRRVDETGQLGQEELPRRRGSRQDARPRRAGPHRSGSRAPRPRLRDERHRSRSLHQREHRARPSHRAGLTGRAVSACRLSVAAHARDAGDAPHLQRRALRSSAARDCASSTRRAGICIDEGALADAIESGHIGGAALDVFQNEPTTDHRLQKLPQVIATPHIAASTREGQELVGVETASALRDYLKTGVIRNAVNFPSLPSEEFQKLQPFTNVARRLGSLLGQMGAARIEGDERPLLRRALGRVESADRQFRARRVAAQHAVDAGDPGECARRWRPNAASTSASRTAPARAATPACSR